MMMPEHAGLEAPSLQLREPGERLKPEEVESPTLPLPPPRDRRELDRLLSAVANTPTGQRDLIRETIADFNDRATVADLLHQALFELPVTDTGRHLMILSVTGELGHESSVEPLERFVWLGDREVHAHAADSAEGQDSVWWPGGALQARAAEMLVWVTAGRYVEGLRRILAEHPLVDVRVATVDAFAFAADDSSDSLEQLRGMVNLDDRWALGLPRRWSGADTAVFDEVVERHEGEGGGQVELPERSGRGEAGGMEAKDVH